jgi:hypothetical protein
VLERHVHHGIEHFDVPPHTVGVQPTCQLAVPELGDVNMAQFIQGQVAKLGHKQRVSLLCATVLNLRRCADGFSRM